MLTETWLYYLIVDTDVDVLMLAETWQYSHGDEAYISAVTPARYDFHSFPSIGSRGVGIGFVTKTSLSTSSSFKPLDYTSFETLEMRLSFDHVSVPIVCLYRPPPSKRKKLTYCMFLEEFSELLSRYADSRSHTVYTHARVCLPMSVLVCLVICVYVCLTMSLLVSRCPYVSASRCVYGSASRYVYTSA